jgi:hypothetical protein
MGRTLAAIATAVIAFSSAALAHAQNEPPATETAEQQEPVEEVIIHGRRTLFGLRRELEVAREHVWDIFNEINSNDDFDISCMNAARTGTRLTKRTCRPQYADTATSRAGKALARRVHQCDPTSGTYGICLEMAMQNGGSEAQAEIGRIAIMDKRLDEEFRRLARERPELAAAILEFLAKEREYDDAARSRDD